MEFLISSSLRWDMFSKTVVNCTFIDTNNIFNCCCTFSKVLSKIVQVALKYQLRMPPYFTLVLRSLACFEGTCNPLLGSSSVWCFDYHGEKKLITIQACFDYVKRQSTFWACISAWIKLMYSNVEPYIFFIWYLFVIWLR